jgi:hypothetical protein
MTAAAYIRQPMTTDAGMPEGRGPVSRWHVATPAGRRWNECRAAGRCLSAGCPAPRYTSPGGWAQLRCGKHEASAHRERWAARHPGYRPYRHRAAGVDALVDAVNE